MRGLVTNIVENKKIPVIVIVNLHLKHLFADMPFVIEKSASFLAEIRAAIDTIKRASQ